MRAGLRVGQMVVMKAVPMADHLAVMMVDHSARLMVDCWDGPKAEKMDT